MSKTAYVVKHCRQPKGNILCGELVEEIDLGWGDTYKKYIIRLSDGRIDDHIFTGDVFFSWDEALEAAEQIRKQVIIELEDALCAHTFKEFAKENCQ